MAIRRRNAEAGAKDGGLAGRWSMPAAILDEAAHRGGGGGGGGGGGDAAVAVVSNK